MPKLTSYCVERVKQAADIVEVCGRWGVVLKKSGTGWAGRCPFHDEKSGSFSVREGKGAKCFGCGWSGDSIKFVMKIAGVEFVEAVELLAGKFGVLLEYEKEKQLNAAAVTTGAPANTITLPAGVDAKAALRAMKRQAKYEAERGAEKRLEDRLRETWASRVKARRVPGWSAVVSERWEQGELSTGEALQLAEMRGWPLAWVKWLIDENLVAWPLLPWGREASVAFRVDAPSGGGLEPVGYHQRFVVQDRKSWLYLPYCPDREKRTNEFLQAIGTEQDALAAQDLGGVPALPFVLGWTKGVRFLVIAEGQWDAVTFAGACGWLDGEASWPEGVCVMGSRGSTGVDTLLAYWGDWLEQERPNVLVLADNDAAGRNWDTAEALDKDVPGSPLKPTFVERLLKRPGLLADESEWVKRARMVRVSRVPADTGKDFNDYWKWRVKAGRPIKPGEISGWLEALGFCASGWRWF